MVEELKGYRCPYCGATLTKTLDNEKFECNFCQNISFRVDNKTNIRMIQAYDEIETYNFEKADELYSNIAKNNKQNPKVYVMALWGNLLAQYGVVGIKDFNDITIETFANYDSENPSILESSYYERIMNSDIEESIKVEYRYRAKELEKKYQAIKNLLKQDNEYEVFICAKVSAKTEKYADLKGDSDDLKDTINIYNDLKKRGVKVFFSEIDLKSGEFYDEQILSAMLKSKKMLVIASREDYLKSPWLESEWRRWLNLMKVTEKNSRTLYTYFPDFENKKFSIPLALRKVNRPKSLTDLLDDISKSCSCIEKVEKKKELSEIEKLIKNAKEGDLNSQYKLFDKYFNGKDVKQDYEEARFWLRKAARKLPKAQYTLANRYYKGDIFEKDYEESFRLYKEAAKAGIKEAQNELGTLYQNGLIDEYGDEIVKVNLKKAIMWYEKAIQQQDKEAQFNLGLLYYKNKEYEEALRCFEKGAKQGYDKAIFMLGLYYELGRVYEKDISKAKACYKKSNYYKAKNRLEKLN